jgi:hypothetical protein
MYAYKSIDSGQDTLGIKAPTTHQSGTVARRSQQVVEMHGKHSVYLSDTSQRGSS